MKTNEVSQILKAEYYIASKGKLPCKNAKERRKQLVVLLLEGS